MPPKRGASGRLCSGIFKASNRWQDRIVQVPKIRVLAVDHNTLLREGLSVLIQSHDDMELVDAVASAKEAVASFAKHRPAVTLMDLDLPGSASIGAIQEIRKLDPEARILGLVTVDWDPACGKALTAGACRCLAKDRLNEELADAVRKCASERGAAG